MESKLPEEIYNDVLAEARSYSKERKFQIAYYDGATAWAPWKVKYDELAEELRQAQLTAKSLRYSLDQRDKQLSEMKERADKMEKSMAHLMDVFKIITIMPVPATEKEYMSWFVYIKNMAGGVISEWEAEKEVAAWKGKEVEGDA